MRVAAPCWPLVLGLAGFGQSLLAALPAHGWEANPPRGTMSPAAASGRSDVRVLGTISDEMVQQAAYNGKPRNASATSADNRETAGFFHDMEFRLPKMPFLRGGGDAKRATTNGPSMMPRGGSTLRPTQTPPQLANRFTTPTNGATPSAMPSARSTSTPPHPLAFNRQQGAQSSAMPRLATPRSNQPTAQGRRAQMAPQGGPQMESLQQAGRPNFGPQASRPTGAMPQTPHRASPNAQSTAIVAAAPQSPADRLIVQAHELSGGAKTIDDYTRVIETCRRARASQPSPQVVRYSSELAGWAMNRRGQLKADAGQLDEAMLDFDDAIRADSNCWRAIHNRGVLLAQSGQFEKAFDDFNRTIALNPEFAKAYSNRAALFVVAGDLLPALQDYGRAIEVDPNLAVAHRGRGRVCHLLGRLDEATGHYDAAVQLAPEDGYAIASRGDLLTDRGRYSEAAADYECAIDLDPKSPQAYRGLAWLMATAPDDSVRDPDRAVELAEYAMHLDQKADAVGFDTLAAAQASAGDFTSAMRTLHKAIEVAPESERTVYQDRLVMYQHAKPFRISPVPPVTQASYESR